MVGQAIPNVKRKWRKKEKDESNKVEETGAKQTTKPIGRRYVVELYQAIDNHFCWAFTVLGVDYSKLWINFVSSVAPVKYSIT